MPTPTENPATYLIELDAFNITKDWVPQKPYTSGDYTIAKNNVDGINAAIDYAVNTLDASIVKLPKGVYTFTFLNRPMGQGHPYENKTCVHIPAHTTLDISGTTIEMMYDSVNRSPYDSSSDPVYMFSGYAFGFFHAENARLLGGEIIGDRYQRDFVTNESAVESTYGIIHNFGSRYCTVDGTVIRGFMGDGIFVGNYPGVSTVEGNDWDPLFSMGSLNPNTGQDSTNTFVNFSNNYKTSYITLPGTAKEHRQVCIITGVGTTRIPDFKNGCCDFYWYDENYNFLGKEVNQILEETKRPDNAKYVRVYLEKQPFNDNTKLFHIQVASDPCTNFTIKNCDISDSNRGGISGGTNHTLIQSCRIYNNGEGWKENAPEFPDTTRYQINFEDSYCLGLTVENCDIGDGRNGILAGVYNAFISQNRFYNLDSGGVLVYANSLTNIENNKFLNVYVPVDMLSSSVLSKRRVLFSNNYVREFMSIFITDDIELRGNYFEGTERHNNPPYTYANRIDFSANSLMSDNHFVDCQFPASTFGANIRNNTFEARDLMFAQPTYLFVDHVDSVVYENIFINYRFLFNKSASTAGTDTKIDFIGCVFDNTAIIYTTPFRLQQVNYIGCTFKNNSYHFSGFYGTSLFPYKAYPKVSFIDSKIYLADNHYAGYDFQYAYAGLMGTYNNDYLAYPNEVMIKDCIIYLQGENTVTIFAKEGGNGYTQIKIDNVIVKKDALNTGTPTFQWYNNLNDSTIVVRNGFVIDDDINYTNIADSKFQKNTAAPLMLPKYIGEEYIWFDTVAGTTHILRGVNTNNLSTAWIQLN